MFKALFLAELLVFLIVEIHVKGIKKWKLAQNVEKQWGTKSMNYTLNSQLVADGFYFKVSLLCPVIFSFEQYSLIIWNLVSFGDYSFLIWLSSRWLFTVELVFQFHWLICWNFIIGFWMNNSYTRPDQVNLLNVESVSIISLFVGTYRLWRGEERCVVIMGQSLELNGRWKRALGVMLMALYRQPTNGVLFCFLLMLYCAFGLSVLLSFKMCLSYWFAGILIV